MPEAVVGAVHARVIDTPLDDAAVRAAVEAHRAKLLEERAKLLTRYTERHPAIRDIDRKIHILEQQLLEP